MMRRTLIALVAALAVAPALPAPAAETQSGYASVNGLEMYYEIHGAGPPLVLLHGALIAIWLAPMVAEFLDAPMPDPK